MLQSSIRLYKNAFSGLSAPIWWLSLIIFINRSGTMVILFMTVYLVERGYSQVEAGYVMAAFGGGAILGGYIGGILTDRIGYYYVQVFSLLLNGIFFILLAYMNTYAQIMACVFLLSTLGDAFRPANSAAIVAYSDDASRTRSYSLNRLAINLGFGIGPALGGILAEKSYTLLFWADGLTCILASLLLFLVFYPDRNAHSFKSKKEPLLPGESAYRDRIFLWGMLVFFLVGVCFFQLFTMMPLYYKTEVHLSKFTTGCVMALNGFLIALFEMVLVYKLEGRRTAFYYTIIGCLLVGSSFILLNTTSAFYIVPLSMIVVTLGEMVFFPFMNNFWIHRSTSRTRGQYAALYTMAFSAAIVLAPPFATQVATHAGYGVLWTINFFICTFAALGFSILKKYVTHG